MNRLIDSEKLKEIETDLLKSVDEICRKENFRYSLGGGTLLGAVRHKGFIPWDDDIDIMMPRPDYDAFISYCLSNAVPFGIKSFENDKNYVDLSAKIYNTETILKDDNIAGGSDIGVNIDVFPVDGLGNTYEEAKKIFDSTSFKRNLLVAAQWRKFFKSKTHSWYYEPFRFLFFLMSRFVNKSKLFDSIQKKYKNVDFDNVNFAAAVGGSYREKEILPKSVFANYVSLPFEGSEFKAISDYDKYLSSLYGEYMKLPPEEKRVSHHTFIAYYKTED